MSRKSSMTRIKSVKSKKALAQLLSEIEHREVIEIDEHHTREAVTLPISRTQRKSIGPGTVAVGPVTFVPNIREVFDVVLSSEFALPDLRASDKIEAVRCLQSLLPLENVEENLVSYWLLDCLSETIREAQLNSMLEENQKITVTWITFVLKQIATYGMKRQDLFKILEEMFLEAVLKLEAGEPIPNPYELLNIILSTQEKEQKDGKKQRESRVSLSALRKNKKRSSSYVVSAKALLERDQRHKDLFLLVDFIYSIFADRFKYAVIYNTFFDPDPIQVETICENILKPKEIAKPIKPAVEAISSASAMVHSKGKIRRDVDISREKTPPSSKTPPTKQGRTGTKSVSRGGGGAQAWLNQLSVGVLMTQSATPPPAEKKLLLPSTHLLPLSLAVTPSFFEKMEWQREVEKPFIIADIIAKPAAYFVHIEKPNTQRRHSL